MKRRQMLKITAVGAAASIGVVAVFSNRELGTARMGSNPKASVVNEFGQTHDISNLFLVDGSIFVSAGSQNPTLDDFGTVVACK